MILGIIPARGGSKGIPRKNIKPLHGRPLIAWTIEAALKSRLLDRFVVTTEDAEIAAVARQYGAEVLDRPVELAGDTVISREVIKHALLAMDAKVSVLLQPTSPIRDDDLIDRVIRAFLDGDYDSMATGYMNPAYPPHGEEHRRQDIGENFVNDGSVVISTVETILAGSLFGQKAGTMVTDRFQNIDIDEEFDFRLAEAVLSWREEDRVDKKLAKRDRLARDRHLLAIHLLSALREEAGEDLAGRIAEKAFKAYTREKWNDIFKGLPEQDRPERFKSLMKETAQSDPGLEIISESTNHMQSKSTSCAAESLYRQYNLTSIFKIFCDQDYEIARMIKPSAGLERSACLADDESECRHRWSF